MTHLAAVTNPVKPVRENHRAHALFFCPIVQYHIGVFRVCRNAQQVEPSDKQAAYGTLYEVLVTLTKLLAPIIPFTAEVLYQNLVRSFNRVPVAVFYILANIALGTHLFHGIWSLFQSLGWSNPRFNKWRRWLAAGISTVVVVANVSFPVAVLAGVVG